MTETAENLDDFLGAKPVSPRARWIKWGAIVVVLLIVLFLLSRCFGGSDEPGYSTQAARTGDLTVTVSATGNLKPVNQVDVGSEQSGLITHVYVDVNDKVTKGQLLAQLDTSRLQDTVNQNRAQVAASQAQVGQAQAQAALARATLSRQEEVYRLSDGKVPSKTELDSARSNNAAAIAAVRAAQAQVDVSRAQLGTALTNLSKARIVSPVNGVVLSRDIEPGQTVAASLNAPVLFTIAEDLQKMEVDVSVDEADVGQVQDGQQASFAVDAFPGRTFPATVNRINVGSNSASTSSSSTTTTTTNSVVAYTAVLSVNNQDETLRPGMTATADIIARQLKNVLLVPNAALRFKPASTGKGGGGIAGKLVMRPGRGNRATQQVNFGSGSSQTLYVLGEDGKPRAVEVIVGESDGARTAILKGAIKPGMKVITGQLAAGQTGAPDDGDGQSQGQRQGGQRRNAGGNGN